MCGIYLSPKPSRGSKDRVLVLVISPLPCKLIVGLVEQGRRSGPYHYGTPVDLTMLELGRAHHFGLRIPLPDTSNRYLLVLC